MLHRWTTIPILLFVLLLFSACPDDEPAAPPTEDVSVADVEQDVDTGPPPQTAPATVAGCAAGGEVRGGAIQGYVCLSPMDPAATVLSGPSGVLQAGPIYPIAP